MTQFLEEQKIQVSEKMESHENIIIVGGGIAGLSLALALLRLGLKSLVLESSESLRVTGAAFVTWTNAWKALDALGVGDLLRSQHCRLSGIIVTSAESGIPTAEISYGNLEVRCVKRRVLLETLSNELPKDTIRFSSKVVSIQPSGHFKLLHLADGTILKAKVVVGCEGVNSIVAKWLGFRQPSFTRRFALRGYVHFEDNHGLNPKFLQFTGHGFRYGIIPCDPTSIYWFCTFFPSNQVEEIEKIPMKMKEFALNNLGKVEDRIKGIIEKTEEQDITYSPLRFRPPWEILLGDISKENVCVAGDAFHPMTPDLGQGACSTLEDTIVLARYLAEAFSERRSEEQEVLEEEKYKKIETSLKKYAKDRKWRGIDLITTAYLVGSMQQSDGKVVTFLRDKVMAPFLASLLLKKAGFDCGLLRIS